VHKVHCQKPPLLKLVSQRPPWKAFSPSLPSCAQTPKNKKNRFPLFRWPPPLSFFPHTAALFLRGGTLQFLWLVTIPQGCAVVFFPLPLKPTHPSLVVDWVSYVCLVEAFVTNRYLCTFKKKLSFLGLGPRSPA